MIPFKQRVAGSNPARPTKLKSQKAPQGIEPLVGLHFFPFVLSRVVPESPCTSHLFVGIFVGILENTSTPAEKIPTDCHETHGCQASEPEGYRQDTEVFR